MNTTILDLFGTADNAVSSLKKALSNDAFWNGMSGHDKVVFQEWAFNNAKNYKDGETLDWVGAFYDWLEA